jgi:hypothetical protein
VLVDVLTRKKLTLLHRSFESRMDQEFKKSKKTVTLREQTHHCWEERERVRETSLRRARA